MSSLFKSDNPSISGIIKYIFGKRISFQEIFLKELSPKLFNALEKVLKA